MAVLTRKTGHTDHLARYSAGASDLICEVFPDLPKHARSAIGTSTLPLGMAVEVEAIVRVK